MNGTSWTEEEIIILRIYYTLRMLQAVFAILGNGITIVVIFKHRNVFTTTNVFIACLAVSDFLAGALVYPLAISAYVANDGSWGWFRICRLKEAVELFIQGATLGSTFLIALDRYLYIMQPFRYQTLLTTNRVITMAVTMFSVSLLIGMGTMYAFSNDNPTSCYYKHMLPSWALYSIIYAFFTANLLLIIFLYYSIARSSLYHGRRVTDQVNSMHTLAHSHSRPLTSPAGSHLGRQPNASVCTQLHVTRIVLVVLGYYLGVYLPSLAVEPFIPDGAPLDWFILRYILLALLYSSTWINPVIYARKNGLFRSALRQLVCCSHQEGHEDPPNDLHPSQSYLSGATTANPV